MKYHRLILYRSSQPWAATLFLLAIVVCWHLLVAGRVGLTVDGAHYALYARHLAWSYYDHPPMVGWLQAFILPVSHGDFAMRIMPIILSALSLLVLYRLSMDLFPNSHPWFGFYTLAAAQTAVFFNIMPLMMLPQQPFILFSLLALLFLYRAVESDKILTWSGFGLSLGLAGLSEYTAVLVALTAFIYILATAPRRFFGIGVWLAALVAGVCALPVLYWNIKHHWISVDYQLHHGTDSQYWHVSNFAVSQLIQFLVYSPIIYLSGWWVLCRHGVRLWRESGSRLLLIMAISVLFVFAWASGYQLTLPHWPALAWMVTVPLIVRYWYRRRHGVMTKIIVIGACCYALFAVSLVYSEFFRPWMPFPDYKNPFIDLYGWRQAASVAKQELKKQCDAIPDSARCPLRLFVPNWSLASRLAWYSGLPVQVTGNYRRTTQFSLWYGKPQAGAGGILVIPQRWQHPPKTGGPGEFSSCTPLRSLTVRQNKHIVQQFHYYNCHHFRT